MVLDSSTPHFFQSSLFYRFYYLVLWNLYLPKELPIYYCLPTIAISLQGAIIFSMAYWNSSQLTSPQSFSTHSIHFLNNGQHGFSTWLFRFSHFRSSFQMTSFQLFFFLFVSQRHKKCYSKNLGLFSSG